MKQVLFDGWGYLKLRLVYPQKSLLSKVKSLLPKPVESLIKEGVVIEEDVSITSSLQEIGTGVFIGQGTRIYHCNRIGSYTSISQNVKIGLRSHPKSWLSTSPVFYSKNRGFHPNENFEEFSGDTIIESDVLISSGSCVLAGVKIEQGAIVGAMSFVNKDVPPYAIVGGIPAKIIGYRFSQEIIEKLLDSQWVKRSPSELINIGSTRDVEMFLEKFKKYE